MDSSALSVFIVANAARKTRDAQSRKIEVAACPCPAFCRRRNRGREHGPLAQSEGFPTEKEEKLVFDRRAAQGSSVLILGERRALDPVLIGKKLVRAQNLVAKELVRRAMPVVASRPGAEVDDTAGEFAPFRTHIVVLD